MGLHFQLMQVLDKLELPGKTALLRGLENGDVLLTDNAGLEKPFHKAPSVLKLKLKAILVIPIRSAEGISGTIYLDHRY